MSIRDLNSLKSAVIHRCVVEEIDWQHGDIDSPLDWRLTRTETPSNSLQRKVLAALSDINVFEGNIL